MLFRMLSGFDAGHGTLSTDPVHLKMLSPESSCLVLWSSSLSSARGCAVAPISSFDVVELNRDGYLRVIYTWVMKETKASYSVHSLFALFTAFPHLRFMFCP